MKKIIVFLFVIAIAVFTAAGDELSIDQSNEINNFIEKRLTDIDHDVDVPIIGVIKGIKELKNEKIRKFVKEELFKACVPIYNPSGKNEMSRMTKVKSYLLSIKDHVPPLLVKFTERKDVNKVKMTEMKVDLADKEAALYPGKIGYLIINLKADNGEIFKAGGQKDQIPFSQFEMEFTGAKLQDSSSSNILLTYSPLESLKFSEATYQIKYKPDPNLVAKGSFPIKYNTQVKANFAGFTGNMGNSGKDGYNSSASLERNGATGPSGGQGSSGGNGNNGEDIDVKIKLIKHPASGEILLYAIIKSITTGNSREYIISTNGGVLNIYNNGGQGGTGGNGGWGGEGSQITSENGTTGLGGRGGTGGNGGIGGNGGKVTVTVESSAKDYFLKLVTINNGGGASGNGGNGGRGGSGGTNYGNQTKGAEGPEGAKGADGIAGKSGPNYEIIYVKSL